MHGVARAGGGWGKRSGEQDETGRALTGRMLTYVARWGVQAFESDGHIIFSKTSVSELPHDAALVDAFHKTILEGILRCACSCC